MVGVDVLYVYLVIKIISNMVCVFGHCGGMLFVFDLYFWNPDSNQRIGVNMFENPRYVGFPVNLP